MNRQKEYKDNHCTDFDLHTNHYTRDYETPKENNHHHDLLDNNDMLLYTSHHNLVQYTNSLEYDLNKQEHYRHYANDNHYLIQI